jgi:hypothetical protein
MTDRCASSSSIVAEYESSSSSAAWESSGGITIGSDTPESLTSPQQIVNGSTQNVCDLQQVLRSDIPLVVFDVAQETFAQTGTFCQYVLVHSHLFPDFANTVA